MSTGSDGGRPGRRSTTPDYVWQRGLVSLAVVDPSASVRDSVRRLSSLAEDIGGSGVLGANVDVGVYDSLTPLARNATVGRRVFVLTELATVSSKVDSDIKQLVDRGTHVVVYTDDQRPGARLRAVQAGAHSVISKVESVRIALSTSPSTQRIGVSELLELSRQFAGSPVPKLSMRELEVLTSYLSGDTAQVTARVLGIGVESGRTYLQRIMNKFRAAGHDVVTRADLVALCYEGYGPWLRPPGLRPWVHP